MARLVTVLPEMYVWMYAWRKATAWAVPCRLSDYPYTQPFLAMHGQVLEHSLPHMARFTGGTRSPLALFPGTPRSMPCDLHLACWAPQACEGVPEGLGTLVCLSDSPAASCGGRRAHRDGLARAKARSWVADVPPCKHQQRFVQLLVLDRMLATAITLSGTSLRIRHMLLFYCVGVLEVLGAAVSTVSVRRL